MADVAKLSAAAVNSEQQPVDISNKENFADESKDVRSTQSQSHSANSHHHDSEYDTASDLEGGEEDEYEDDEDESLGVDGEEEDVDSENGSIVFDLERQRGDGQETDHAKSVDEDRSNPQYIPKRGTFYEHDDRTADEPEGETKDGDEQAGEGDTAKSSTPTVSAQSKTMKKWQPASAVDRWSHDRYDESEQAPKSRSELVSAYGYDIRSEDGPPRTRRRRYYGRGPSRYVRNWEDESAYIKSNSQRKPRAEDFPALGDKKNRKVKSYREEKENRYDKPNEKNPGGYKSGGSSHREGRSDRRNSGKSFRSNRSTMEFKNQNKTRLVNDSQNKTTSRQIEKTEPNRGHSGEPKNQVESASFTNTKGSGSNQKEKYNAHEAGHLNSLPNQREIKEKGIVHNTNALNNRQQQQAQHQIQQQHQLQQQLQQQSQQHSQVSSRLQIQSRNDPSHVGSVQMHSLITGTNQQDNQAQQSQQQTSNEASRTKRYSNLRQRTQNDSVMGQQAPQIDQHTMQQQLQLHDQHQQQPQPQHVLLPEQHLLQTNLMQLYHTQENIQAQMQGVTIQSLPPQPKTQYQNVQPQYQTSQPQSAPPPPSYYAPTGDYTGGNPTAPPQNQYAPPQQTATYLQQPGATPQIAYNTQSPPPVQPPTQQIPAALNYVQTAQNPAPAGPYQNFSGYQNYNTVGGTTYFVPQQQPPPRPVVLPQRRPTNAIPILAPPSDKNKQKNLNDKEDDKLTTNTSNAPIGSAENIDHILDNMFVQRPPLQPLTRKSSSPANDSPSSGNNTLGAVTDATTSTISITAAISADEDVNNAENATNVSGISTATPSGNEDLHLEEAMKDLSVSNNESTENKSAIESSQNPSSNPSQTPPGAVVAVTPTVDQSQNETG